MTMDSYIRRSFWWLMICMLLLSGAMFAALYWLSLELEAMVIQAIVQYGGMDWFLMDDLTLSFEAFRLFIPAVLLGAFLIFTILLWIRLRFGAKRMGAEPGKAKAAGKGKKGKKAPKAEEPKGPTARERAQERERQTLHLLSMLQREGRLLDFFAEDLSLYEDDQIGAAVRGVHEACVKLLNKRVKPAPVIDSAEGETVTVDPGFDPASIKLTGNVTGDPPFKGVLRHKGWRAAKYDMPTLVSQSDPRLLCPAEVEVE